MVTVAMKLKDTLWTESYHQLRQHIKKQRYYFVNKGPSSQGYGFSSGHVWMWELDHKESWAPKNWCFWTVVLEKTLENHLDCKEIQPVHSERDQSGVFIGRTDVEYIMRNVNTSWNQDDTTLMAESELLKSLLMKVKEESEKVGLKVQKSKIMASGPITSWQIDGERVADFFFLGAPKSLQMVTAAMKLKATYSLEG